MRCARSGLLAAGLTNGLFEPVKLAMGSFGRLTCRVEVLIGPLADSSNFGKHALDPNVTFFFFVAVDRHSGSVSRPIHERRWRIPLARLGWRVEAEPA